MTKHYIAKSSVISFNSLVWKFCGNAQFLHSFGRFAQNYAQTVPFKNFLPRKLNEITVFYAVLLFEDESILKILTIKRSTIEKLLNELGLEYLKDRRGMQILYLVTYNQQITFMIESNHETLIRRGITCKKIPCYLHDTACRWFFVKKAKIFWSYVKCFWILQRVINFVDMTLQKNLGNLGRI